MHTLPKLIKRAAPLMKRKLSLMKKKLLTMTKEIIESRSSKWYSKKYSINISMRWNVLLVAGCSLIFERCLLHFLFCCFFLFARCVLLFTRRSLFFACWFLIFTLYIILFSRCFGYERFGPLNILLIIKINDYSPGNFVVLFLKTICHIEKANTSLKPVIICSLFDGCIKFVQESFETLPVKDKNSSFPFRSFILLLSKR